MSVSESARNTVAVKPIGTSSSGCSAELGLVDSLESKQQNSGAMSKPIAGTGLTTGGTSTRQNSTTIAISDNTLTKYLQGR